jgi:hypothetical protein
LILAEEENFVVKLRVSPVAPDGFQVMVCNLQMAISHIPFLPARLTENFVACKTTNSTETTDFPVLVFFVRTTYQAVTMSNACARMLFSDAPSSICAALSTPSAPLSYAQSNTFHQIKGSFPKPAPGGSQVNIRDKSSILLGTSPILNEAFLTVEALSSKGDWNFFRISSASRLSFVRRDLS